MPRLPFSRLAAALLALSLATAHAAPGPVPISLLPANAHRQPLAGPGYFVLYVKAGKTRHLHALLTNHGKRRATLAITPVDAEHDAAGNISYNLPAAPRSGVGAWIRLARPRFRVSAGKSIVVSFDLQVPAHTRPGLYVGALTAYVPLPKLDATRGAVIQVQTRLADAVVVHVQPAAGRSSR